MGVAERKPFGVVCEKCTYRGKMTIKRGKKKDIMYCPQCGHVINWRYKY